MISFSRIKIPRSSTFSFLLALAFATGALVTQVACVQSRSGKIAQPGQTAQSQGGVDVGNMKSTATSTRLIPNTDASIRFPDNWRIEEKSDSLTLDNRGGSTIVAQKAGISEVAPLTPLALQKFLKEKYPQRDYKIVTVNALVGVRADLIADANSIKSDVYLISETDQLLHLTADLKNEHDGIRDGQEILSTVRVAYKGEAIADSRAKTVTLTSYGLTTADRMKAAYSLGGECYTYTECQNGDVQVGAVLFDNRSTPNVLTLSGAGRSSGRIVDLGSDDSIGFDQVKVDGKYLIAPSGKIPISDIYSEFSPKSGASDHADEELLAGHTYLLRLVDWPSLDMISKIHVDKLESRHSVTLTYQNLVAVPKAELQKQVDAMNEYTRTVEMPRERGEVTLYNRSYTSNYFYASFNFKYATSGNSYITNNAWDILYQGGPLNGGAAQFSSPKTSLSLAQMIDFGAGVDLDGITRDTFPSLRNGQRASQNAVVGHTYGVAQYDYDGELRMGAFTVAEVDPEEKWVRLKWRRIFVGPVPHFSNWIDLGFSTEIQKVTLERSGSTNVGTRTSEFRAFVGKRADEANKDGSTILWYNDDELEADSRPYADSNGYVVMPKGTDLDSITRDQVEALRGKFERFPKIQPGDILACLFENFEDKTVMAVRIESLTKEKLQMSYKYLYRGKTPMSDAKE